jgi:hypothetical protein
VLPIDYEPAAKLAGHQEGYRQMAGRSLQGCVATFAGAREAFLCYRRDDANPAAYGIYERLKVAFGERGVFLDHYGFMGGEDWRVKTQNRFSSRPVRSLSLSTKTG